MKFGKLDPFRRRDYKRLNLEYHRHRACSGKRQHATRAEAEEVVDRMIGTGRQRPGEKLNVYLCGFCGRFHVGTYLEGGSEA
jgi:hypothetical protein